MIDREEVFAYLDMLRESGAVNMFGAGSYVQEEFNCDRQEARQLVLEWMETFSAREAAGEAYGT